MNMNMAHLWNHKDRDKLKDLHKSHPVLSPESNLGSLK